MRLIRRRAVIGLAPPARPVTAPHLSGHHRDRAITFADVSRSVPQTVAARRPSLVRYQAEEVYRRVFNPGSLDCGLFSVIASTHDVLDEIEIQVAELRHLLEVAYA